MKWNSPDTKPDVANDYGYRTESVPVLCKVSYLPEDDLPDDVKRIIPRKRVVTFCVCKYHIYKDTPSHWEPVIDHLTAYTAPCADYNIVAVEGFKVLKWADIPLK